MNDPTTARPAARWLNRTVVGIAMASLWSDLSHEAITPLLPGLLASFGAAAATLGIVEGVADGLSTAAKLYGGWLADRLRRRKPLCAAGYGAMSVAPIVMGLATGWLTVLAGRSLAWISRGIRSPARKALLADAVTPEQYGRAFGFERAMDTTGAVIAPVAAWALLTAGFAPASIVLFSALPAFAAAFCILALVRERTDRQPRTVPFLRSFRGYGSPFYRFLATAGLFGLGDYADTFYVLYAVSVLTPALGAGRAAAIAVILYAVHNAVSALCAGIGGGLADRISRRLLLACGYGFTCAATLGIFFGVDRIPSLVVLFALGGAGVGIYEALEDTVAAALLPSQTRGGGFGLLAMVTGLGDLASSVIFGTLWAAFGAQTASAVVLLPMLLGTVAALRLQLPSPHAAREFSAPPR